MFQLVSGVKVLLLRKAFRVTQKKNEKPGNSCRDEQLQNKKKNSTQCNYQRAQQIKQKIVGAAWKNLLSLSFTL